MSSKTLCEANGRGGQDALISMTGSESKLKQSGFPTLTHYTTDLSSALAKGRSRPNNV